ncbi:hypothetical protein WK24_07910 [Burkholderia vietnamiensis]|nr:hypothetical protein WK24_07910 [Burkholderia vietnamiensis]
MFRQAIYRRLERGERVLRRGGVYPILDVKVRSMTFDGRPVATEGNKMASSASLIASQGGLHMSSRFRRRWRHWRRNVQ